MGLKLQPSLRLGDASFKPWLLVSVEPVSINHRRHFIVAVDNITKSKQAEEALRQELAERRLVEATLQETESLLFEAQQRAHMGTRIFDIATQEMRWSDEIYHILGLPVVASMGFGEFVQYLHPDDYLVFIDSWNSINEGRSSIEMEYRIIRPSGEIRHVRESTVNKYNESGILRQCRKHYT